MNETRDARTATIKLFAIIGFIAIFLFIGWLIVQGIRLAPGAFGSLASIAESIRDYRPIDELSVDTGKSIVNSGESFELNWTDMKRPGKYQFAYSCTEGVLLSVRGAENELITIPCSDTLSFDETVHGIFVTIESEKNRFSDVPFVVAFDADGKDTRTEHTGKVTVVNATIPLAVGTFTESDETDAVTETTLTPPTKPASSQEVASAITALPVVNQTIHTYLPESDPKGFTDLAISFVGVGTMNGSSFVPSATFDTDLRGGFRFEVKNIGTKTSGDWTFTTELPGDIVYTSDTQVALKPNEKVLFTLGFTLDDDEAKSTTIKAVVDEKTDKNEKNDSLSWFVKITN